MSKIIIEKNVIKKIFYNWQKKRFFNENPTFDFAIHPNMGVMQKIKSEMRKTGISYGLSEICDTISSDPGRYNLVVNHKDKDKPPFVATKFDKRVFETKERAVEHLFAYYSDERFTSKIEREEKPGKNSPMFSRALSRNLFCHPIIIMISMKS